MSRGLSTTNEAQVDAQHLHEVALVQFGFDTPVYVHSGIGSITYDSNTYLGMGDLGTISAPRESEALGPAPITLGLEGVTSDYIGEALDSGNLYDEVTIYVGYRQDDGTLVADPWILWKGWYEYGSIELGDESEVQITCQHDLSQISEKKGDRYSDEDAQSKNAGDVAFEFTASTKNQKLLWAGGRVDTGTFDQDPIRGDRR